MAKPTDICVVEAESKKKSYAYRTPMKFGGRVVTDVVVVQVRTTVKTRGDGSSAVGIGEMTMGNVWAWPSKKLTAVQTERIIVALAERIAKAAVTEQIGHPLELTKTLNEVARKMADDLAAQMKLPEPIPALAVLLAASPTEAAIHDAFGRVHNACSFDLLGSDYCTPDLSEFLTPEFAGQYLDSYISKAPKPMMPLYHLVGALDPLSPGDIKKRVDDGLPETLEEWIKREGIGHLKIKLDGDDQDWDVGRVIEVDRIVNQSGLDKQWKYSIDFNERCPNEDYVLEFLERIDRLSRSSMERLHYIEQPSIRDLASRTDMTMHRVSRLKPVVIDESLIDLNSLQLARQQGYSGIALKACKGQSEALLMAAAAKHYNLFICVQDLTCVGASFLHSASLAARIPAVTAIEGNGRQYCPAGNADWEETYGPMFHPRNGSIPTEILSGNGLGFDWPESDLSN